MIADTTSARADAGRRRPRMRRRLMGLAVAVLLLGALSAASLFWGSAALPADVVWRALTDPDGSVTSVTVNTARVDRTLLGILVGAALGVSGALIQALTRNPLADPGILGVNAGAGFAVTLAVAFLGVVRIDQYLPFAFVGAIAASAIVYLAAGAGRGSGSPVRLTLVGVAFAAVLTGFSHTLSLVDADTFNRMRFWGAGTLADRPTGTVEAIVPAVVIGLAIAALCVRPLNALALGEDTARAVGVRLGAA
uniref:iron chelate uptake ABC transporter family permease subunit n=1 Tax=Microbacterium sp. TaxID=51671 RepID=UPI00289B7ACA